MRDWTCYSQWNLFVPIINKYIHYFWNQIYFLNKNNNFLFIVIILNLRKSIYPSVILTVLKAMNEYLFFIETTSSSYVCLTVKIIDLSKLFCGISTFSFFVRNSFFYGKKKLLVFCVKLSCIVVGDEILTLILLKESGFPRIRFSKNFNLVQFSCGMQWNWFAI